MKAWRWVLPVLVLGACGGDFSTMGAMGDRAAERDLSGRERILTGEVPHPDDFSLAGFISEHSYDFPAPSPDTNVTVHSLATFMRNPQARGPRTLLLIGVTARTMTETTRAPIDVVAVIDRSGSMSGEKIVKAREALAMLSAKLDTGDRLGIVSYAASARWDLPLDEHSTADIADAISEITDGGGTNIFDGLETAYAAFDTDTTRTRWVVLLSDGNPNEGVTDDDAILRLVRLYRDAGIGTSAIAVGGDANSFLMESMGPAGGGSYHFLQDPEPLGEVFAREVEVLSRPIADEMTISLSPSAGYRFGEVYGFDSAPGVAEPTIYVPRIFYEERPGGFIAEYERVPGSGNAADWGTITVSYKLVDSGTPVTVTVPVGLPFDPEADTREQFHAHHSALKADLVLTAGRAIVDTLAAVWYGEDLDRAFARVDEAVEVIEKRRAPIKDDVELEEDLALLRKLRENLSGGYGDDVTETASAVTGGVE